MFALSGNSKAFVGKLRLIYALVAGGSFYLFWLLWNVTGIVAGSYLPDLTQLGLDFAIAVTFIALVVPTVTNLPMVITVAVAALLSVLFTLLHFELDLVAAAIIAMYCGYLTDRWQCRRQLSNQSLIASKELSKMKNNGDES